MLKVAIVGASGYAGGELIRLVSKHPELELRTVTANSSIGQSVSALVDFSGNYGELTFVETSQENLKNHDVIFLALPHTQSAEVAQYISAETLVLDCGADFRLKSADDYLKFYGSEHHGTWDYGMPELLTESGKQRANLVGKNRIAVPGCNATAVTLACAPLLASDLIEPEDLVSTLSVGTSGAGRNASVNIDGLSSAYAYQIGGIHRHIPEILQNLQPLAKSKISLTFTPVLVPMFRGILAVNTARLKPTVSESDVRDAFNSACSNEPYVRLLDAGASPNTKDVEFSNQVQISFSLDQSSGRVTVISALDNLVKGTAGAAIQCMNIALGFDQQLGLGDT
jgi:N-acetyl-gamma-glutamyl-phosphate reductase